MPKRSFMGGLSRYIPVFKKRRNNTWGLNSGYKRKGYRSNKRSTYRPMSRYRQKSKFNVSKLRARRRTAGLKNKKTSIIYTIYVLHFMTKDDVSSFYDER